MIGAVAVHLDERFIDDVFAQTLGLAGGGISAQAQETIDVYLVDPHGIVMSQLRGQDWLGRNLGALSPDLEARIAQARPLGGDCPADNPQCPPVEKIARLPEPMPAVQPLGDAVAQALQTGQPGSLRYCHPDDPAAPPDQQACRGQYVRGRLCAGGRPVRRRMPGCSPWSSTCRRPASWVRSTASASWAISSPA